MLILSPLLILFLPPFRIVGKPSLLDALFLFEELLDGPERRETDDAAEGAPKEARDEERRHGASYAKEQEHPPRAGAEIIMRLDDDGVEDADDHKSGHAEQESFVVHNCCFIVWFVKEKNKRGRNGCRCKSSIIL